MSPEEIKSAIEKDILPKANSAPVPGSTPDEMAKAGLDGVGGLDKLRINFGAGIDSAIKGVQGLLGGGPDDAAIKQKRTADSALADNTTGGAAMQFVGEAAPTLAIPGAGFVKGAQMAMRVAPTAARLGTVAAAGDAAIGGALGGAAQLTTSDESRLFNAAVGAVGGAALSGLIAAAKPVAQLLTSGGAQAKAAAELVRAMGGEKEAEAALAKMRAYAPSPVTKDIPMSAAEITQNPALGRAERSAQARYTENWAPFREEQTKARYDALNRATAGADNLPALTKARADATSPMRADALRAAEGEDFVTPVNAAASWMREGAAGTNPAVQKVVGYVESNVGEHVTPEQLYSVRQTLLDKLNGKAKIGDDLGAATKAARRETMAMVNAIDDSLDGATAGKWSPYLKEYASKSGEVNSAEALALIRKGFEKETAPQLAGVPYVTGARLARSIEKNGENSFGSKLTPDARGGLQDLQDNIGMTEGLQKLLKLTGTGGGGSNTAMDLTGLAASAAQNKIAGVVPVLGKLLQRSSDMTQAAMSDALRNPEVFIAGVTKKLSQSRPLTRSEESVLALLRSAGAGASLELATQQ